MMTIENMDIINEIQNMPDMQMLNDTVEINSLLGNTHFIQKLS